MTSARKLFHKGFTGASLGFALLGMFSFLPRNNQNSIEQQRET
jgi:hypothetical protein